MDRRSMRPGLVETRIKHGLCLEQPAMRGSIQTIFSQALRDVELCVNAAT